MFDIVKKQNGIQIKVEKEFKFQDAEMILEFGLIERLTQWIREKEEWDAHYLIAEKNIGKANKRIKDAQKWLAEHIDPKQAFEFEGYIIEADMGDLYDNFGTGQWKALYVTVKEDQDDKWGFVRFKIPVAVAENWSAVLSMSEDEIYDLIHK